MATKEVMTVHKALAELKVLDSRIESAILSGDFVITKKNNQDTVKGKTAEQYKTKAAEVFQKASDLILRRNAIKNAVVVSNANTKVKIGDVEYTVVEAIEKKNHGMDFYVQLRDVLRQQLAEQKSELEKHNASLQQKAEQFAVAMMGGKDVKGVKTDSDEYIASMNTYIKANTMTLLDPLGIEAKIEELDDMINSFLPEVDAALSVSNAVTTITIEY